MQLVSRRPLKKTEQAREQMHGAQRLAAALVRGSIDTIRDARDLLVSDTCPDRKRNTAMREIADEVGWLTSTGTNPLGFKALCQSLHLNGALIRRQVAAELNTVPGDGLRRFVDRLNG